MPIQICAGSDKTLLKQEEVERIYWFGERSITIREKTSFDLDKVCGLCVATTMRVLKLSESLGQWDRLQLVACGSSEG